MRRPPDEAKRLASFLTSHFGSSLTPGSLAPTPRPQPTDLLENVARYLSAGPESPTNRVTVIAAPSGHP
jgi:hypothetical protein